MNRILKTFFLAGFVSLFASCSDDNEVQPEPKNEYTFDGKTYAITGTYINTGEFGRNNYDFKFYAKENDLNATISLQLSAAWDGQEVDLTKVDNAYAWSWDINYRIQASSASSSTVILLQGFGRQADRFGDVAGGTLYIELLDADTKTFEVKLDMVTTGGKKLKLTYKGTLDSIS